MKKVYLLAAVAAVLFGALMFLFLSGSGAGTTNTQTKTVVVATVDIAPDVTITENMVEEKQVPADSVQVNVLSSKSDVVGKCSPAQISKGQQLVSNMLEDSSTAGRRLAAQLENGMYGMTIKVETDAGVGGYVKAGDHIDLLGSELDEDGNVTNVELIVENVEVLRVNEATNEGTTPYEYLTLSMDLDQCEAVYEYQAVIPSGAAADYHAILRAAGDAQ